ncbi:MAG: hypothetical protein K0R73_1254, partial [Candidatus Midichloriaceae bacterium]|nr:hypothetical protein [Candidatus Midichloriaceae bacterium]
MDLEYIPDIGKIFWSAFLTIDFLREIYHGLIDTVVIDNHRYLFDQVDL